MIILLKKKLKDTAHLDCTQQGESVPHYALHNLKFLHILNQERKLPEYINSCKLLQQ